MANALSYGKRLVLRQMSCLTANVLINDKRLVDFRDSIDSETRQKFFKIS
jgi:hypothetical protein